MQQRRTRWTFRLIALVLIGFLAACGLASSPNLIHLGQSPQAEDPPAVTLYFDGDPTTFAIADLAVSLALFLNPSADTAQIQSIGEEIFGLQLTPAQITGAGSDPLASFDFNGDNNPGQIEDLGVALAVFLGASTPTDINSVCQEVLGLSCNVTDNRRIPRPDATPFPVGSPSPSPIGTPIPEPSPSPSPIGTPIPEPSLTPCPVASPFPAQLDPLPPIAVGESISPVLQIGSFSGEELSGFADFTLSWSVDPTAGVTPSASSEISPQFTFSEAGTYTISVSGSYDGSVGGGCPPNIISFSDSQVQQVIANAVVPTIGVPQTVNGSLTTSDELDPIELPDAFYKDDYRLTGVSAGQVIRISLNSSQFDGFLLIIDADDGSVIDTNDDFGGSTNSQLDLAIQPGVSYLIRVTTFSQREVGQYQLTTALVPMMPPPSPNPGSGAFNIEIEFIDNSLTSSQQAIVLQAARRWEQIITADLPDTTVTLAQGFCNGGFPPVALNSRPVDDLLVQVTGARLLTGPGSPGGTIGQAGPCGRGRPGSNIFPYGRVALDPFDVDSLEADGDLFETVLHELGHTLGVGTIPNWQPLLTGVGTNDPRFRGSQAVSQYNNLGGFGNVPVEIQIEGHWRDSLGDELMIPSISNNSRLSRITAAALTDLGFGGINLTAADPYTLPSGATQNGSGVEKRDERRIPVGNDIVIGPFLDDLSMIEQYRSHDKSQRIR